MKINLTKDEWQFFKDIVDQNIEYNFNKEDRKMYKGILKKLGKKCVEEKEEVQE